MKCLLVFVGILALASTGELTCPLRGFNVTAKALSGEWKEVKSSRDAFCSRLKLMDGARDVLNWRMLRKEIKEVEILHSRFLIDGNHTLRTVLSNGLTSARLTLMNPDVRNLLVLGTCDNNGTTPEFHVLTRTKLTNLELELVQNITQNAKLIDVVHDHKVCSSATKQVFSATLLVILTVLRYW